MSTVEQLIVYQVLGQICVKKTQATHGMEMGKWGKVGVIRSQSEVDYFLFIVFSEGYTFQIWRVSVIMASHN